MESNNSSLNKKLTASNIPEASNLYSDVPNYDFNETLSSKEALRYLLDGTLRLRVCRYCLKTSENLNELDEIIVISGKSGLFEVTIKDIIASFYSVRVSYNENIPNKICGGCLNKALECYLFTQQCERTERALHNYFEDIYEKFEKLDPIEPVKKRGKPKSNINHNVLYAEHENVIDYAEPIINLINLNALPNSNENNDLECQKCWKILPNQVSLLNHEKSHPKSMWYNCKQCGKSFVKYFQLKKHKRQEHFQKKEESQEDIFTCIQCGEQNTMLWRHFLHLEKHRFSSKLNNVIQPKASCSICFGKSQTMVSLDETMLVHGGGEKLKGEKSISNIISTVFPDITNPSLYGNKICKDCLNKLMTTFIFLLCVKNNRKRIENCISVMTESLKNVDESKNVLIEVSENAILPFEDNLKDECKEEFLEDEFRIPESESDSDISEKSSSTDDILSDNPARNVTKTYGKKNMLNGYQKPVYMDEFLDYKFNKKSKIPKFTCPICSKHFISDYFLKKHILRHTPKITECKICSLTFKSQFSLKEHFKMVHIWNIQDFENCLVCGRLFRDSRKFQLHLKTHENKCCLLCDKIFKSQPQFDTHLQRHAIKYNTNRSNILTCSFCECPCSNENELSLHVNKVHLQMKPYGCDMCEKQFYTERNLNSHKKLHSLKSKEECEFCYKKFKCRKNMVVHLRKHINIKPHSCLVCAKSFYSESGVKCHMKKCHGGKYCCRLCKHVLSNKRELKLHLKFPHNI